MTTNAAASSAPVEEVPSATASNDPANKEKATIDGTEPTLNRYNPYAGMDPNNPNSVSIPPEEFQAMMRKKKAVGIPPLGILQEKSKQRAAAAAASNNNNNNNNNIKEGGVSIDVAVNVDTTNDNDKVVVKIDDVESIKEHEHEQEHEPVLPEKTKPEEQGDSNAENIPPRLQKYLRMQKAGVSNQAILQLARVKQVITNKESARELERLLGMNSENNYDDCDDAVAAAADRESASASPGGAISSHTAPPPHFQRFLKMKKQGIPTQKILQMAKLQEYDCAELEEWLSSSSSSSSLSISNNNRLRPADCTKYVKMRMKGSEVPFILEVATNQGATDSEITELERILAEVEPTKTTKTIIATHTENKDDTSAAAAAAKATTAKEGSVSGEDNASNTTDPTNSKALPISKHYFTPVKNSDKPGAETDAEDDEKVAFHRVQTSPLASLVRKMVHTVDKTSRSRNRRNKQNSSEPGGSIRDEDMVINSKTLYHALGSFRGVRFARDAYNETCAASDISNDALHESRKKNAGWVRAKRQSFKEIAKTIGLKLPSIGQAAGIDGLDALIDYIEDRYKEDIRESLSLLQNDNLYDFDSLASLYVPGSRVVAKNIASGGTDMICRVSWNRIKTGITITGKESKFFEVCFEFVVAVGTNQATIAEVVEGIENFEGRRNVFSRGPDGLRFIPWMAYNQEDQNSVLERYRRRGRIYNEVALNHRQDDGGSCTEKDPILPSSSPRPTFSYKAYRKSCFFVKRGGFGGTANSALAARGMGTGGRIVIDAQGAYDYGNSLNVGYDPMIAGIQYKMKEYKLHESRFASGGSGSSSTANGDNKYIVDAAGNSYSTSSSSYIKAGANSDDGDSGGMVLFDTIPDDYLEMVWPCVIGFSLTAKAWGDCLVDGLEDIQFSKDIFDRLVLPDDRKRLIKALVKHSSHISSSNVGAGNVESKYSFQDLIQGKGEGSVFLLYGPPGVGKTLTAEAVAETLQRPLYSLSMGTLGTTADNLERRLSEILKLSAKWDAIILLDEADSFLEKRSSTSSLERNAMVCVMLQLVEYFSGILFLTSNRMDSLDPAFQTRITLSLPYHNLSTEGRQKIWDNLLFKSGVRNLQNQEGKSSSCWINTKELAKYPLNGREIKNALRLALALAAEEECTLTHELLLDTSAMVKPVSDSCDINTHPLSSGTNNRRHFVLRLLLGLVLPLLIAMMYELFIVQRDDLLNDFSENNNIDRKNFRLFSWFKRDGAFASLSRQQ